MMTTLWLFFAFLAVLAGAAFLVRGGTRAQRPIPIPIRHHHRRDEDR